MSLLKISPLLVCGALLPASGLIAQAQTQAQAQAQIPKVELPPVVVPSLYEADYGTRLSGSNDLWWCESARKVGQQRALPAATQQSAAAAMQLARNEYEAVQIVARPEKAVSNVMVTVGDLVGPRGARIAAKNITVDEVEYVGVRQATDRIGAVGYWPDPLPPLKKPINLKANTNQPFWITVFAPKGIPGGVYKGTVQLKGSGWTRRVPLNVTVWDFTLPDETHVRSVMGATPERIADYHNVQGEDLAKVVALYHENYAKHRITPQDTVYGSEIKIDWGNIQQRAWRGGTLDKAQLYNGNESLFISDDDAKGSPAILSPLTRVKAGEKYTAKWTARTPVEGQVYRVTVETLDRNDARTPKGTTDFDIVGSTQWKTETFDVTESFKNPLVKSVRIQLRPVKWTQNGELTGKAWFNEVEVLDAQGKDVFNGGGHFVANKNPVTADQVKLDFTKFDKAVEEAVSKYHITSLRVPVRSETGLGASLSTYSPGMIQGYPEDTPEYDILFGSYLKQIQDHFEAKGWLDMAFLYWADEPNPEIMDRVTHTQNKIRAAAPKINWILPLHYFSKDPRFDPVDIWVPITERFDPEQAEIRKAAGKEVWWYICVNPKAPYAGEFIDHPAIEPRMWLWQTWQNKVQGILIWTTVFWNGGSPKYPGQLQNPWLDTMSWGGGTSPMGNGDGRYFYPPNRDPNNDKRPYIEGPINSMRWELMRDGVEDYEYFWMLQQQVDAAEKRTNLNAAQKNWLASARELLIVPKDISASLTDFTKDPVKLLNQRARIAGAILTGQKLIS